MHPADLTTEQHAEWLNNNPRSEIQALLHSGKILHAWEIVALCGALRGDHAALLIFPLIRDRIMLRWSSAPRGCVLSAIRVPDEAPERRRIPAATPFSSTPGIMPSPGAQIIAVRRLDIREVD